MILIAPLFSHVLENIFSHGEPRYIVRSIDPYWSRLHMVSAANYQEIDVGVKLLRQKDKTKNKNEKKITETEIETKLKPASFLVIFKQSCWAKKRMLLLYLPRILLKSKSSVNKTMRFLKPDSWHLIP